MKDEKQKTPIEELIDRWEKEKEEAIRECPEKISGLYNLFIKDAKEMLPKEREVNEKKDAEISKLQAFKGYVHKRLDDAGIEKDPESPHKEQGCRIGGRLDIVLNEISKLTEQLKSADEAIEWLDMVRKDGGWADEYTTKKLEATLERYNKLKSASGSNLQQ